MNTTILIDVFVAGGFHTADKKSGSWQIFERLPQSLSIFQTRSDPATPTTRVDVSPCVRHNGQFALARGRTHTTIILLKCLWLDAFTPQTKSLAPGRSLSG